MLFTHVFYYLSAQGWAYVLARWWVSLLWTVAWTALDYWLISEAGSARAVDLWVYRFAGPGLLGWATGALLSEGVLRAAPISFGLHNGAYPFYAAGLLVQGFLYWLCLAFGSSNVVPASMAITVVTCSVFLWLMHGFARWSGRFGRIEYDDGDDLGERRRRRDYYAAWAVVLLATLLAWLIASIWLPDDMQTSRAYFYTVVGTGAVTLALIVLAYVVNGTATATATNTTPSYDRPTVVVGAKVPSSSSFDHDRHQHVYVRPHDGWHVLYHS